MSTTQKTTVLRTVHTGLTVSSLDDAIAFWCGALDFEFTARKTLGAGPSIENVVGVPGADIEIAIVTAPDGHQIELLEYRGPVDRKIHQPRSCDVGSAHLTFAVSDLDETLRRVEDAGWMRLGAPQTMPNGMRVVYVRGPEGHTVEFMKLPD
ncbi:VOC family protein [Robbsia andropogonis]|uniref:VOC family protein n=1 Tax=Robbsia andropogonis TaxID=28092 RepID=UPI0020A193A4|nr:VOC family protein [Robbsia andropogonis]MCP1117903.1 VOC family protein [Robbsia andropogonis]MCP1127367.1 VOC family protein [Robbsia andropogonis]